MGCEHGGVAAVAVVHRTVPAVEATVVVVAVTVANPTETGRDRLFATLLLAVIQQRLDIRKSKIVAVIDLSDRVVLV